MTGPALPGGWPGRLYSQLCLCSSFMSSAGQRLREAAGEEGPARWWERDQRPLLIHRQTNNSLPVKVKRSRNPFLFSFTSLPFGLHAALLLLVFSFQDVSDVNFC